MYSYFHPFAFNQPIIADSGSGKGLPACSLAEDSTAGEGQQLREKFGFHGPQVIFHLEAFGWIVSQLHKRVILMPWA